MKQGKKGVNQKLIFSKATYAKELKFWPLIEADIRIKLAPVWFLEHLWGAQSRLESAILWMNVKDISKNLVNRGIRTSAHERAVLAPYLKCQSPLTEMPKTGIGFEQLFHYVTREN